MALNCFCQVLRARYFYDKVLNDSEVQASSLATGRILQLLSDSLAEEWKLSKILCLFMEAEVWKTSREVEDYLL